MDVTEFNRAALEYLDRNQSADKCGVVDAGSLAFSKGRIQQDYWELITHSHTLPGIWIAQNGDDTYTWSLSLSAPTRSELDGSIFKGIIQFQKTYPFAPPKVVFTSPIFHPNVNSNGELFVDKLRAEDWNPCTSLWCVLLSIQFLLVEPVTVNSINAQATALYKENKSEYFRHVRELAHKRSENEPWLGQHLLDFGVPLTRTSPLLLN